MVRASVPDWKLCMSRAYYRSNKIPSSHSLGNEESFWLMASGDTIHMAREEWQQKWLVCGGRNVAVASQVSEVQRAEGSG